MCFVISLILMFIYFWCLSITLVLTQRLDDFVLLLLNFNLAQSGIYVIHH